MKKIIALLLVLLLTFTSVLCYAQAYVNPHSLPQGTIAEYDQYFEDLNVTRLSPWIKHYHMETANEYKNGRYGGEGGQVVMTLSISPVNTNKVFMGSDTEGGWISNDCGATWQMIDNNVNTWAVVDSKWHPTDENSLYIIESFAGEYEVKHAASSVDGFYKSKDGGKSFTQILDKNVITYHGAENLINFDRYNNLYILTSEGMYKSTDDGETFTCLGKLVKNDSATPKHSFLPASNNTYTDDFTAFVNSSYVSPDGKTIVVCTQYGMFVTTNGGTSWNRSCVTNSDATCSSIAVDPTNSNHWVAVYNSSMKMYVSTNAGTSWSEMTFVKYGNGKYTPEIVKFGPAKSDGKPTIYTIFTNMNCPFRYNLDGTRTSFNNTTDWKSPTLTGYCQDRFLSAAYGYFSEGFAVCDSDPNLLFFSFGDIIYKSTDGGATFDISNAGFSGNYVNQFLFDNKNRIWMAYTDKGLGVTDYEYDGVKLPTAHMATPGSGTSASVLIDPKNENHIFTNLGGWTTQRLVESFDGGQTWNERPDTDSNCSWATMKYVADNKIVASNYTSTDNGATWTKNQYSIVAISNIDTNVMYAADGYTIYRTKDGGATWNSYYLSGNGGLYAFTPDEFDINVLWVGAYNGTITKVTYGKATGNGSSKTYGEINGITSYNSFDYTSICAIAQDPDDAKHLVAGGKSTHAGLKSIGLIETYDGGNTWYQVKGFKGPMVVQTLAFSPVSDEIFIGTCSNGTLIYEYKKYSPINNKIKFDVNGLLTETPEEITGNYGDVVTAPDLSVSPNIKFNGWRLSYSTHELDGTEINHEKIIAPGEDMLVEYKDMTYIADYDYVTQADFECSQDGGNTYNKTFVIKNGLMKATMPLDYTGIAIPIMAVYDNKTSKLLQTVVGNYKYINGQDDVSLEINLDYDDINEKTLKLFIWNSLDEISPIKFADQLFYYEK